MELWKTIGGLVECELTSADPAGSLRNLERSGIVLQDVQAVGMLTVRFTVSRRDYKLVCQQAEKRGEELVVHGKRGIYWTIAQLWKRPVLALGMVMLLLLSFWVPTRIFFVRVEGNYNVYTNEILESAGRCGIHFGASRREVRSEKMKNALLEQMPQLQWAGVNTYGCVAVITVQERTIQKQQSDSPAVSSIVAARDGVIRSLTVLRGSSQCTLGQTVKAGEVLISGYTDFGNFVRGDKADGEIFAETLRKLTVIMPTNRADRQEKTGSMKKYSLIIGKKRINLYNSSGISDATCVKIYSEQYVTLPGGFVLPVALVVEEQMICQTVSGQEPDAQTILHSFITAYLQSQMVGGQILSASSVITEGEGFCRMDGIYGCLEMIGITRTEESILEYENH